MQTLKQRSRIMSFLPDVRDRRRVQNRRYAILAFLIPFLVLFLAYAVRGVFPFGNRHILTVDLYHQYAPFMAVYRDKILTEDLLFTPSPAVWDSIFTHFSLIT